jgi:uncharacterized protein HemX
MKKTLIAAVAVSLALALSILAVEVGQAQNVPVQSFDQNKTEMLKMLDTRITSLQEAKNCIQAAQTNDDITVCREKHRAEMREMRGVMRPQRGMGGPMGR